MDGFCAQDSTSGGLRCQKCEGNLIVSRVDGTCGESWASESGSVLHRVWWSVVVVVAMAVRGDGKYLRLRHSQVWCRMLQPLAGTWACWGTLSSWSSSESTPHPACQTVRYCVAQLSTCLCHNGRCS